MSIGQIFVENPRRLLSSALSNSVMVDHGIRVLIEMAAREELGESELAGLAARARDDLRVRDALRTAREEYEAMSKAMSSEFEFEDLAAIRDAIKARAATERRHAAVWMVGLPVLCICFAGVSVLTMEDRTNAHLKRAGWLVLGIGGTGALAVLMWSRWYTVRATRAALGDVRHVSAWVRSRARGFERQRTLESICTIVFVILVVINLVIALSDADLVAAAFWFGLSLVPWVFGVVHRQIEDRHES